MKKLYTLLAAAAVASSAMAINPNVELKSSITPEQMQAKVIERAQGMDKLNTNAQPEGMMKVTDASGTTWSLLISNMGFVTEAFGLYQQTPGDLDEYDIPLYALQFNAQPMSQTDQSRYFFFIAWPCYGALDENCQDADGRIDADKVKEIYGDKAMQPMSVDDFRAAWGDYPLFAVPGFYNMPSIWSYTLLSQGQQSQCRNAAGTEIFLCEAEIVNNSWNYGNATTLDWKSLDTETMDIDMDLTVAYSGTYGGAMAGKISQQYSGEGLVLGFGNVNWNTVGEVHIFNAGIQEDNLSDYGMAYTEDFSNMRYYYIAFCDETYIYQGVDRETEQTIASYGEDTLPGEVDPTTGQYINEFGMPLGWNGQEPRNYAYFGGALWVPGDVDNPFGMYTMAESKYTVNAAGNRIVSYDMPPIAYNLVSSQYAWPDAGLTRDGFKGIFQSYYMYPVEEHTWLGVGDETNGVNFKIQTGSTGDYYIMGKFTGDIILHNTPNQWITEQGTVPACVSGIKANALDADPSSVEAIESNAPEVARAFYNFQGQRLNAEPENGMYIIRSVKADGSVKAIKVAK